ncbi:MAG: acetylornithine deacetylase [Alphaproteobacteria bacterium]
MPSESAVLDILARLIAFDTTSRSSNLALIEWVEQFLSGRGIETRRVPNAEGTKANLHALIGPEAAGGVVLSGHTDVVPIDGQPWTSDPWTLTKRDGKYFGRGTADMKTFLALALAHVDEAKAASLKRPLILAFSYDEEIGCFGAPGLIADIAAIYPRPSAVIVGEPTSMKVLSGHKGVATLVVTVNGREAHSSQPHRGVSANAEALKLMQFVLRMAQEALENAPKDSPFEPPSATLTIGKVEGGTASNILARECTFVWDVRWPPHEDAERYIERFAKEAAKLDAEIKERAPEGGVRWVRRSYTPSLAPSRAGEAEIIARALTGDNETHVASYAAEAGLFQQAEFPVVLCGPGSIDQAHQPDEWIAEEQIDEGARFMRGLIKRLSA